MGKKRFRSQKQPEFVQRGRTKTKKEQCKKRQKHDGDWRAKFCSQWCQRLLKHLNKIQIMLERKKRDQSKNGSPYFEF